MTRAVPLFRFMPYGAPELQAVARPYMLRALFAGSVLCVMGFAAAGLLQLLPRTHVEGSPGAIDISVILPPPPSIIRALVPEFVAPVAPKHIAEGVPVPRPEDLKSLDTTIPSQDERRYAYPGIEPGGGTIEEPPKVSEEPLPKINEWVYFEEPPAIVSAVGPEYPELARSAGVSGQVRVNVLVGKDGRVLEAQVDRRYSVPMLDDAALEAARRFVFTPALANGRPVAVWVRLPFDFRLQ